jgi:hypothetical protein
VKKPKPWIWLVALAELLPPWLDCVAVRLIDWENRQHERFLKELADGIALFFREVAGAIEHDRITRKLDAEIRKRDRLLASAGLAQMTDEEFFRHRASALQNASMQNALAQNGLAAMRTYSPAASGNLFSGTIFPGLVDYSGARF